MRMYICIALLMSVLTKINSKACDEYWNDFIEKHDKNLDLVFF